MVKRAANFDDTLAQWLKEEGSGMQIITEFLAEGVNLQDALNMYISSYGVKDYAKLAKMDPSNLARAIKKGFNPTHETLQKILKPLGLQLGVCEIKRKKGKKKAA